MTKGYTISDLFFTKWEELSGKTIAEVYALYLTAQSLEKDSKEYGYVLISILRRLRRRPMLVDKINVDQAVDIFNDLEFLHTPWYFFPKIQCLELKTPAEKLARHTFDHFIYADNEYSSYVVTQDSKYLNRLIATIYQDPFDKEAVETIAAALRLKPWEKHLVFYTFSHVREFVMKRCKTLLPPGGSSEETKPQATGRMWLKIKHRLSETPAFQGYDTAGTANMYSTLDYLEDLAQIRDESERRNRK
jgi:5-methylcytosine-specific restriction endonuclease McrA